MSATLSATPEPIAKRSDERKIARLRALLLLGHEGVMLDKIQQQAAHALRLAKRVVNGTEEDSATDEQPGAPEEEGQVGVNLGNETHNHFEIVVKDDPKIESPVTVVEKPPVIPAPIAVLPAAIAPVNPLLAAVLGGALVLGGAAIGAMWPGGEEPTSMVDTDTDTDTSYELHLPP